MSPAEPQKHDYPVVKLTSPADAAMRARRRRTSPARGRRPSRRVLGAQAQYARILRDTALVIDTAGVLMRRVARLLGDASATPGPARPRRRSRGAANARQRRIREQLGRPRRYEEFVMESLSRAETEIARVAREQAAGGADDE